MTDSPLQGTLELAVDTFGDVSLDDAGALLPMPQVIRNVVDQGALADQVGIDFFGIGEHHRPDYSISSPEMVLSAIAARTSRIRLGSAVTVLSSDDPIRVYQRFSTLDAVSNGRAEVILGRGSFTESFPLFGFDLKDYETLFTEKLEVFLQLLDGDPVTWEGTYRTPLRNQAVYPPSDQGLRAWIAIGGSPDSVIRAASARLPLIMAIIGGSADRFAPLADLYRRACDQLGSGFLPLGVHSPGHVADTDEMAMEQLWPHYRALIERLGRERGWAPPSEAHFRAEVESGSVYAGSPETVARRIAETVRTLGLQRFEMKYSSGAMPHSQLMRSLELYGTQVIPLVRELLA